MSETNDLNNIDGSKPKRKVGFFLFLGILFFPFVFAWFTLRPGHSTLSRVLSIIWAVASIASFIKSNDKSSPNYAITRTKKAPVKVKLQKVKESCAVISKEFSNSSSLSDLQREEAWKSYEDKAFKWTMKVTEVSQSMIGSGFVVQYKCKNSPSFGSDIAISYPASAKSAVLKLKKGSYYDVSGKLKSYNSFLGLNADAI